MRLEAAARASAVGGCTGGVGRRGHRQWVALLPRAPDSLGEGEAEEEGRGERGGEAGGNEAAGRPQDGGDARQVYGLPFLPAGEEEEEAGRKRKKKEEEESSPKLFPIVLSWCADTGLVGQGSALALRCLVLVCVHCRAHR